MISTEIHLYFQGFFFLSRVSSHRIMAIELFQLVFLLQGHQFLYDYLLGHFGFLVSYSCLVICTRFNFICKRMQNKLWASLVTQTVKNPPSMQETWVQSPCWEDPLEEGVATHSSILAWKIPWTAEPGRLLTVGLQRVRHD